MQLKLQFKEDTSFLLIYSLMFSFLRNHDLENIQSRSHLFFGKIAPENIGILTGKRMYWRLFMNKEVSALQLS